jgi:hypothetical protein
MVLQCADAIKVHLKSIYPAAVATPGVTCPVPWIELRRSSREYPHRAMQGVAGSGGVGRGAGWRRGRELMCGTLDGAQPVLFCTATLQLIVRKRRLSLPLQMSTPQLSVGPQLERARAQISARAQTASLRAHNSTLCARSNSAPQTRLAPSLVPRFRFQPFPSVQDRSCLLLNSDLFAREHAVDGADEGTARDVGLHGCGVMHTCD